MKETVLPACTALLLFRVSWTCSIGGGGVGSVEGVPVAGGEGVFVGVCDTVTDGDFDVLVGEGEGVSSAKTGGALPTMKTMPVPRLMIRGFRTDRASTAHNLPTPRHTRIATDPRGAARLMRSRDSRSINRTDTVILQQLSDDLLV